MISVVLHPRDAVYDVELDGEMIITGARDPEHEAARAMQARGLTGPFQTTKPDGRVRMIYPSIENAARFSQQESASEGFRLARYSPHPRAVAREPRSFRREATEYHPSDKTHSGGDGAA